MRYNEEDYKEDYNNNYYTEDQDKTNAALNNLVKIYSDIYDLTFDELMSLELNGKAASKQFTEALTKLRILKLKEQRILDNIEPYLEIEEYPMVELFLSEQIDNKEKRIQVKNRMGYVFTKRDLLYNNMFEGPDRQEAQRKFESISEILLRFIYSISKKKSTKAIKEKYELSYLYPEIEDEMICMGFDTQNKFFFKEETEAELLNINPEDYKVEKEADNYDYISDLITELESNSESDINTIKLKLDIIKFGIKKLPTLDISVLYQMCQYNLNFDSTPKLTKKKTVLQRLYSILEKELIKRKDYEETLQRQEESISTSEENENMEKIPKDIIDIMIYLINQINDIFDTGIELANLESQNKDFTQVLQKLQFQVEREKQLINQKTSITYNTKKYIKTIIDSYLYFIVAIHMNTLDEDEIKNRCDLIEKRIQHLIPGLTFEDYSTYKTPQVPYYILQTQLIETIKSFEKIIKKSTNRRSLITIKYEEILSNPDLTDDFISNDGNINNITVLDEYTLSVILGIDLEEYRYDKEELLYECAKIYLHALTEEKQKTLGQEPHIVFQITYVQNLLKHLNVKKLNVIENDYMHMDSEFHQLVLNEKANRKTKIERTKVRRK